MKLFQRTLCLCCILILVIVVLPFSVHAHPGSTDSNGGHYDYSTGEYHYHHGYPAHDHYDMNGDGIIDCPYDFDDKTGENSGTSSNDGGNSSKGGYTGTYYDRNTSTSSSTSQVKENTSKNTKSTELSFINMIESLFFIILGIIILGFLVIALYVMIVSLLAVPCSWLWKLVKRNLDEDKNQTYAFITANVVVCVLLYVFFLFPVVEELIANPNVLAAILIIAGILVFIGLLIYSKQVKRAEELNRSVLSKEQEITSLIEEAKALKESEKRSASWESTLRDRTARIAELEEANHTLWATIEQLRSPVSSEDNFRKTPTNEEAISIPDDIYFINGGIPVKGTIRDRKPYGDFTVYVAKRGKCFHKDPYCGSGLMDAEHIYEVLGKKVPCQRCAYACRKTVPDWYVDVKRAIHKPPTYQNAAPSTSGNAEPQEYEASNADDLTGKKSREATLVDQLSFMPVSGSSSKHLHLSSDCVEVSEDYLVEVALSMGVSSIAALAIMNFERKNKGLPPLKNTYEEVNNY